MTPQVLGTPSLAARLRWRLNRAFERNAEPRHLFSAGRACLHTGESRQPFLFVPWVPAHGDALMRSIDASEQLLAPLRLFKQPELLTQRRKINAYVLDRPAAYRRMLLGVLAPLRDRIAGLVLTLDWPPAMRQLAYACRELQIPTILLPHEAVFADRARYYQDRITCADAPICDSVLCWGHLQRTIFLERGVEPERLQVVGSPKLDSAVNFVPALTRTAFLAAHELDSHRPVVLFAMQPLDSQHSPRDALTAQSEAVRDVIEQTGALGAQLLLRYPPSGHEVLSSPVSSLAARSTHVRADKPPYRTSPQESIWHSAVVCSINSTMLLEATIMQRGSISMRYVQFEDLWGRAGIPVVSDSDALRRTLAEQLAAGAVPARAGLDWAAHAFSVGSFDGKSSERIREALCDMRRNRLPKVQDPLARLEHCGPGDPLAGTVAIGGVARSRAQHIAELVRARTVIVDGPLSLAQTADFAARCAHAAGTIELRDQLGRPAVIVEAGPLREHGWRARPISLRLVDDTHEGHAVSVRRRIESAPRLDEERRKRSAACISLLRRYLLELSRQHASEGVHHEGRLLLVDEWRHRADDGLVEARFRDMLEHALEQPQQVVIHRRRHPIKGANAGFYTDRFLRDYRKTQLTVEDSSRSCSHLLASSSEVWVVQSDVGMEALVAGRRVRCYGQPSFAGWGLTWDREPPAGPTGKLDLEQLFHAYYLDRCFYYAVRRRRAASLEEALEDLLESGESSDHPSPEGRFVAC